MILAKALYPNQKNCHFLIRVSVFGLLSTFGPSAFGFLARWGFALLTRQKLLLNPAHAACRFR